MTLSEVPIPRPSEGEVLIKVKAAATCGTDLKAYLRGHPQIPMPGLFGHEYSGIVAEAGPGAKFAPGDEVMGVHSAPCQHCFYCLSGQENMCEHIMKTKVLGAYAEYLLIPKHISSKNLFLKPDSISFNRAALLEPLSCVAQALALVKHHISDRVLIIGPGAIGLMFAAALRAEGIHDVSVVGTNEKRLEAAAALGARPILSGAEREGLGRGYDIVIECTGKVDVWEMSIDYVRRGGQLILFGGCPSGTRASFDTGRLHYDQISVISPFHFGCGEVRQAREWLLNLAIPFDLLISGERSLEDAPAVFEDLKAGRGIKYAFRP